MANTYIYTNGNLSSGSGVTSSNVGSGVGSVGSTSAVQGTLTSPGVSINGSIAYTDPYAAKRTSDSPDLPAIVIEGRDDTGRLVTMKLQPEGNISAGDTMKILMLSIAVINGSHMFNALAYVKKHNLERHFTYS